MSEEGLDRTCVGPDCSGPSACSGEGYSRRFECRPEFPAGRGVISDVVDASSIRQHKVKDLLLGKISDVLSGDNETILGFGLPNWFVVVPKQSYDAEKHESPYQKFAVKSLWREPSTVDDTRGFIQLGVWIRLLNLPEEARAGLRAGMEFYKGRKFPTCLNGCGHVLEFAGFESGSNQLSARLLPHHFLGDLVRDGLTWQGRPIKFEVIRTSELEMHFFHQKIGVATYLTPVRHLNRHLEPITNGKIGAAWRGALGFIGLGEKPAPKRVVAPIAPAMPASADYCRDIHVRVSNATYFGSTLRLLANSHALFEVVQTRVKASEFFEKPLEPFPVVKSFVTRMKKKVLFTPFTIGLILRHLAPEMIDLGARGENNIFDMLRTNEKYNLVVLMDGLDEDGNEEPSRIVLSRIRAGAHAKGIKGKIKRFFAKMGDWILSKHVLMSRYIPRVGFAAECWKDEQGRIHINLNSGTFQPKKEHQLAALAFAQKVFPHFVFVLEDGAGGPD